MPEPILLTSAASAAWLAALVGATFCCARHAGKGECLQLHRLMSDKAIMSADVSGRAARTRELPPGAIPGRYGGYLMPWKPGERGNPQGKRGDEFLACQRL